MATDEKVEEIQLLAETILKSGGFALDFGGSVIKVVYRTKDDYLQAKVAAPGVSGVRIISFSASRLSEALQHLRSHCYFIRPEGGEPTPVVGSGVGCSANKQKIERELNVTLKIARERDCFVNAFRCICDHFRKDHVVLPLSQDAIREADDINVKMMAFIQGVDSDSEANEETNMQISNCVEIIDERPYAALDLYPCLLLVCGSGISLIKVPREGPYEYIDESTRGGRMFLSLGNILTKAKTYDELVDLASRGDSNALDVTGKEIKAEGSGNITYSGIPDEYIGYSFGNACGVSDKKLESYSREDLAGTLLATVCRDLAQTAHLEALSLQINHVFFAGSFVRHPLVQHVMTREFLIRKAYRGENAMVDFQFVKAGAHLGALGGFMAT